MYRYVCMRTEEYKNILIFLLDKSVSIDKRFLLSMLCFDGIIKVFLGHFAIFTQLKGSQQPQFEKF